MLTDLMRRCRALAGAALVATTTGTTAMATDPAVPGPVTLINVFEVPEGQLDQTIAFWERARDFLKDQPGFLDTHLHQSLSAQARFQLVNVARWQSPAAFKAAIGKMQASDEGPGPDGTVFHAALYQVIRDRKESD